MSNLFDVLEKKISGKNLKIVFPEGLDDRVLAAAGRLAKDQLVTTSCHWECSRSSSKSKPIKCFFRWH